MSKQKYLAATSDIWSRSNRSFIAVTIHFVDELTNETKSVFIACESFAGRHTKQAVGEKLYCIFQKYGIEKKVYFITTDGAGEYVWSITDIGDNYKSFDVRNMRSTYVAACDSNEIEEPNNEGDAVNLDEDVEHDSDDVPMDVDDGSNAQDATLAFTVETAMEEIVNDELDTRIPNLPQLNRIACCSHMLEKVSSI